MLGDLMKVLQGELAFVQLAVTEDVVDQAVHHSLNSGGGGLRQRATGRFHHVRQHNQSGFLGLRLGARIAEETLLHVVVALVDRFKGHGAQTN